MGLGLEGQGGLPLYQRGAEVWGLALIGAQRLGGACSATIPQCPATLAEGRLGQGQEGAAVLPTARPPSREKDTRERNPSLPHPPLGGETEASKAWSPIRDL